MAQPSTAAPTETPGAGTPPGGSAPAEGRRRDPARERRAHFWGLAARLAEREQEPVSGADEPGAAGQPAPSPEGARSWRRLVLAFGRSR
ncbi:MAG: hypothetical protein ACQGVK_06390 [Myxococcota bacterium]